MQRARRSLPLSVAAVAGAAIACGHPSTQTEGYQAEAGMGTMDGDPGGPLVDGPPSAPTGPCNAVVQQRGIEGFTHVPECSYVEYGTKPPSSGNHYAIWAAFKTYGAPIPEGFWVHDLEHGGIVLSYNCPDEGCASDIAAAQTLIDGQPDDPLCDSVGGAPRVRMTMTPDPNLDVRFAASAWGWTLRADCFDPTTFGAFVTAHYGHGREHACGQGLDVSSGLPDGCGEDD